MKQDASRADIYTRITDQIITALERGVKPWTQPWRTSQGAVTRPLRHTGEAYSGINVLTLWCSSMEHGFESPTWMTFKQALEYGAAVRKGEKGSPVVYASTIERSEENPETGEAEACSIPFLKSYTVFNSEQIDGLPERFHIASKVEPNPDQRIANAEAFFGDIGADIRHGGTSAFYAPSPDYIQMPRFEVFLGAEGYYATLAHEMTHWTRHASRLDRDLGRKTFGDAGYAREELVAELGAAFLCADLGLTLEDREDHASYIASWLQVLQNDKRAIFSAAAYAQRAVDYLHSLQKPERSSANVDGEAYSSM